MTIPAVLAAANGNPPATSVNVLVTITATDSVSGAIDQETSILAIMLRPAVSTLVLTPPSLNVGVNPGGSLTRRFVVSNQAYAPSNNSVVTLQDPATYNWVSLGNANLGNIASGDQREFQVLINPPDSLPLGTYTVLFNVSGGSNPLQGTLTISVTQSTLGSALFIVSDDTGAKVNGATVTLIGKTNNKTFQGVTGSDGKALIGGVDAGDYSYVVAAQFHDPGTGAVSVSANATVEVKVILTYNVVSLDFSVTPTTVADQYNVTLKVTSRYRESIYIDFSTSKAANISAGKSNSKTPNWWGPFGIARRSEKMDLRPHRRDRALHSRGCVQVNLYASQRQACTPFSVDRLS
ncbi:MAG: carboxypeptidase regulatory-like domain-containing protein [Candidatus Solibacter sp.]